MKKLLLFLLFPLFCLSQTPCDEDICVVQFNAGWNSANYVAWVDDLKDCEVKYIGIAVDAKSQSKFKITVVPTIIVFNGSEVERYEADISFSMQATKKEVQEVVNEIVMDQF